MDVRSTDQHSIVYSKGFTTYFHDLVHIWFLFYLGSRRRLDTEAIRGCELVALEQGSAGHLIWLRKTLIAQK